MVKTQFEKNVKILWSDNGLEFTCLSRFYYENGIIHQTSVVNTPQQNGRVERKHRHILNVARALRFQANLPINFWRECVMTVAYVINRTPTPLLGGQSPHEILFDTPPTYTLLRVFGCLCYANNRPRVKDKFGSRSRRCIFVGYPYGKKGWRLYDLETKEYFVSRDVLFCESQFPFKNHEKDKEINDSFINNDSPIVYDDPSLVRGSEEDQLQHHMATVPEEMEITDLREEVVPSIIGETLVQEAREEDIHVSEEYINNEQA